MLMRAARGQETPEDEVAGRHADERDERAPRPAMAQDGEQHYPEHEGGEPFSWQRQSELSGGRRRRAGNDADLNQRFPAERTFLFQ